MYILITELPPVVFFLRMETILGTYVPCVDDEHVQGGCVHVCEMYLHMRRIVCACEEI